MTRQDDDKNAAYETEPRKSDLPYPKPRPQEADPVFNPDN